ncbi:nitroreductase family protein [Spirillospora sp. NPDC049652]
MATSAGEATRRYLRAMDERRPLPVDWNAAPPAYKRYLHAERMALDEGVAWAGELLRALLGLTRIAWDHPQDETGAVVPGPVRLRIGRPAPSGGGLYPIDAYVADGRALCHYDVVHHGLEVVRPGDHRPALGDLLARPAPAPDMIVGLAARWWRNGFKYGDFAYRLACQEIGVLAAQALAVAESLGLRATVHLDFDAQAADRLLGLDPDAEAALALIVLSDLRGGASVTGGLGLAYGPCATPAELPVPVNERLPHLAALHAATRHRPSAAGPDGDPTPPAPSGRLVPLPEVPSLRPAEGIGRRASAPNGFRPGRLPLDELAQILATACRRPDGELPDIDDQSPGVAPYLLALRIAGLPVGVYRYLPDQHALGRICDGMGLGRLLGGPLQSNTREGLRTAAAALIPVGDPLARIGRFGDLWYRIQQAESGLVLHRAALAAHASGRTARIHSDAANTVTDATLGLSESPWRSLSALLLGSPRSSGPTRQAPVWPAQRQACADDPNGTPVPEGGDATCPRTSQT